MDGGVWVQVGLLQWLSLLLGAAAFLLGEVGTVSLVSLMPQ